MDVTLVWTGSEFKPADDRTEKYCGKLAQGIIIGATILTGKDEIDMTRHNQFFAVLDRCVESLPWYNIQNNRDREAAKEDLLLKLKYECGFTRVMTGIDGIVRSIPLSLEFGSGVTEPQREAFRSMAYAVLCKVMNCSRAELFGI